MRCGGGETRFYISWTFYGKLVGLIWTMFHIFGGWMCMNSSWTEWYLGFNPPFPITVARMSDTSFFCCAHCLDWFDINVDFGWVWYSWWLLCNLRRWSWRYTRMMWPFLAWLVMFFSDQGQHIADKTSHSNTIKKVPISPSRLRVSWKVTWFYKAGCRIRLTFFCVLVSSLLVADSFNTSPNSWALHIPCKDASFANQFCIPFAHHSLLSAPWMSPAVVGGFSFTHPSIDAWCIHPTISS